LDYFIGINFDINEMEEFPKLVENNLQARYKIISLLVAIQCDVL